MISNAIAYLEHGTGHAEHPVIYGGDCSGTAVRCHGLRPDHQETLFVDETGPVAGPGSCEAVFRSIIIVLDGCTYQLLGNIW